MFHAFRTWPTKLNGRIYARCFIDHKSLNFAGIQSNQALEINDKVTTKLEGLSVDELRNLMHKIGGDPKGLKKKELVIACASIILEKSGHTLELPEDEENDNNFDQHNVVECISKVDINKVDINKASMNTVNSSTVDNNKVDIDKVDINKVDSSKIDLDNVDNAISLPALADIKTPTHPIGTYKITRSDSTRLNTGTLNNGKYYLPQQQQRQWSKSL